MPKKKTNQDSVGQAIEELAVVASTIEEEKKKGLEETSETVTLAVHLPFDMTFRDMPDKNGGVKTIVLKGLNSALHGKATGVLLGDGESLAQTISRYDWENLKRLHGREAAFIGVNGRPPCIWEVGTVENFKHIRDEVAEQVHGLEPIDPNAVSGIEETPEDERA